MFESVLKPWWLCILYVYSCMLYMYRCNSCMSHERLLRGIYKSP